MREVVVVPTFRRSDFLWCALEAIRIAEPTIPIHVFPDRGTDETEVCEQFGAVQHATLQHSYHGNSYNVLEALRWAYLENAERVYVIEDDAIVDPSFFSWARTALARKPDAFAACGWEYSPDAVPGDGPDLLIPWYLSVCAAIPRHSLFQIVQHAKLEYYGAMQRYLDQSFPTSHRRGTMHFEQDGLTLRVCEAAGQRCVWPRRSRAVHIGFTGYHVQGKALKGTLTERVALIKLALRTPVVLQRLMSGGAPPEVQRCESCKTTLLADTYDGCDARIVCVGCFHQKHPELSVTTSSHYYLPVTD